MYLERATWDQWSRITCTHDDLAMMVRALWANFFKRPLDTLPEDWTNARDEIRGWFFQAKWFEVYDFVEFCPQNFPDEGETNTKFRQFCNNAMLKENAGYRFVGSEIVEITSPDEIESIEEAQALPGKFSVVSEHLTKAVQLMSDRKNPDYRNSIKESISAVESMSSLLAGTKTADLTAALRILEKRHRLHGALRKGFETLYGFTSDADGVRHALLEESNLTFADAKFMLVACSAFVNYLKHFIAV